jgi:Raf kinase inhibitor-like YbhB/YbcL family protein
MEIKSSALAGGHFPTRYSKDGLNVSPPVQWTRVPKKAKELVLLFESVTPATREPFVHWLVYKIPAQWHGLPEGFKHQLDPKHPADVFHGLNSMGGHGYDGPLGTAGKTTRLRFTLLAIDRHLDVPPGLDKTAVLQAIDGYLLDQAEMFVTYQRAAA